MEIIFPDNALTCYSCCHSMTRLCVMNVSKFMINFGPRGYKTYLLLNSTEHEISTAHKKLKYQQIKKFLDLSLSDVVYIMLINVKMITLVAF